MPKIFPQFEPLDLSHKPQVESLTSRFHPYSDFNFTSLFCYNTNGCVALSDLHGNVAVRFADYLTGLPFYSFIGDAYADETAHTLLTHARDEVGVAELKLVPESTAQNLDRNRFEVQEDPDNVDYILSVDRLKTYNGSVLKPCRNSVTRFLRSHIPETRLLDLANPEVQKELKTLFLAWAKQKKIPFDQTENEFKAISNIFKLPTYDRLVTIGVFVEGQLAGFSISEILANGYATTHFEKGNPSRHVGIYQYMTQETARILSTMECAFINYQQDMGLPGLKTYKKGYHPISYLKKFRVTWK